MSGILGYESSSAGHRRGISSMASHNALKTEELGCREMYVVDARLQSRSEVFRWFWVTQNKIVEVFLQSFNVDCSAGGTARAFIRQAYWSMAILQ